MSSIRRLAAAAVIALTVGVVGCDAADVTDETSGASRYEVAPEPSLVIGDENLGPEYALDRVMGATRLSNGEIAIANGGSSEIRFYDSSGTHLRSAGGEGDGPGEYRGIYAMHRLPGDSLLISSFQPGITRLSPTGEYIDSETVDLWSMRIPCRLGESGWHLMHDGRYLMVMSDNFSGSECPKSPDGAWRMTALLGIWQPPKVALDTLAIIQGTERMGGNYRVYGADAVVAFDDERIFALDSRSDSIFTWSTTGQPLPTMSHGFPAEPIPPEAKTEDLRRWTGRDGQERVGAEYIYAETYPRVARMITDESGNLWVMKYPRLTEPASSWPLANVWGAQTGPRPTEWRILSSETGLIGEATLPDGLFPMEIGDDYILGITKDELDVQRIILYSLNHTD